jgi:hypothetical protein
MWREIYAGITASHKAFVGSRTQSDFAARNAINRK